MPRSLHTRASRSSAASRGGEQLRHAACLHATTAVVFMAAMGERAAAGVGHSLRRGYMADSLRCRTFKEGRPHSLLAVAVVVVVLVVVVGLAVVCGVVCLCMSLCLTLVNACTACWMSSLLCAALICVRMRAAPFGTTGYEKPMTYTPSYSTAAAAAAHTQPAAMSVGYDRAGR